ncbi:MAG: PEP-CTERM sorting domain-containing protein [Pseudomonadota bacterium]
MKLTKLIAAVSLGLASLTASAIPLASLSGPVEIKLGGLTNESNAIAGTTETTWGIGYIESMKAQTNTGQWLAGTGEGYLYYMIYGIADLSIIPDGAGFDIYNIGATGGSFDGKIHLDIYYSATQIANIDQFKNASPADRIDYNSYAAYAGLGSPYLQLTFGSDIQQVDRPETPQDERLATLVQNANAQTLPTSGDGKFFLDVIGGTAMTQWDTNGQAFGHDMSGNFTLRPNFGPDFNPNCTEQQVIDNVCFPGLINDPIIAASVPEPGSLAMLGLGLFGLAGLRRRKSAAK